MLAQAKSNPYIAADIWIHMYMLPYTAHMCKTMLQMITILNDVIYTFNGNLYRSINIVLGVHVWLLRELSPAKLKMRSLALRFVSAGSASLKCTNDLLTARQRNVIENNTSSFIESMRTGWPLAIRCCARCPSFGVHWRQEMLYK